MYTIKWKKRSATSSRNNSEIAANHVIRAESFGGREKRHKGIFIPANGRNYLSNPITTVTTTQKNKVYVLSVEEQETVVVVVLGVVSSFFDSVKYVQQKKLGLDEILFEAFVKTHLFSLKMIVVSNEFCCEKKCPSLRLFLQLLLQKYCLYRVLLPTLFLAHELGQELDGKGEYYGRVLFCRDCVESLEVSELQG